MSSSNEPEKVINSENGMVESLLGKGRGSPRILLGQASSARTGSGLLVTVVGKNGNTAAIGAKLTLELSSGLRIIRIVQAGSGYLSSYSGPQHFGIPAGSEPERLSVEWPDGTSTEINEFAGANISVSWQ